MERVPARFEVLDERFDGTGGDRWLERVFDQGRWLEGRPTTRRVGSCCSATLPTTACCAYDEVSGWVDSFVQPAGFPNGRTLDRQGRFVTCEHGARRVTAAPAT